MTRYRGMTISRYPEFRVPIETGGAENPAARFARGIRLISASQSLSLLLDPSNHVLV